MMTLTTLTTLMTDNSGDSDDFGDYGDSGDSDHSVTSLSNLVSFFSLDEQGPLALHEYLFVEICLHGILCPNGMTFKKMQHVFDNWKNCML